MTADDLVRFDTLRADLFEAIRVLLAQDGHCKSYEGSFRVQFPNYFEETRTSALLSNPTPWGLLLDCYLIGPERHYDWWGATFAEVLQKAETDIRAWMHEAQEDE